MEFGLNVTLNTFLFMKSVIQSLMMNSQTLDLTLYVPREKRYLLLHLELGVTERLKNYGCCSHPHPCKLNDNLTIEVPVSANFYNYITSTPYNMKY